MKAFWYEFKFHVDNMQAVLWYTHCKELTEFRKWRTLIEYFKQEKVTPKDYCEKIRDLLQDLCIQKSNNTFEAEYIPPLDWTVIDCWANQGYKSLIYAFQVWRNWKVIAIEWDEWNHLQIEKNAALNKIENISAVRAVVWAESRKRVSFSGERVAKRTWDRIKMVKIDDFYDDEPCFLKIDVEGYEHEVLKWAVRVLHTYHPLLEIELHTEEFLARYWSSRKKVVEFLREHNYDIVFSRGKEFPYEKLWNY